MAQLETGTRARASGLRWLASAMLVVCFVSSCSAKVTIDWCFQPTVGGSPVSTPLKVGCGEEVEFVWCSTSRHSLVELIPGGGCDDVLAGAQDNVDLTGPGTTKTLKLTVTGTRAFKCGPHCGGGMRVDLATTCAPAPTPAPAPALAPKPAAGPKPALGPKPAGPASGPSGAKVEPPKPPKLVVDWCFQPAVNGTKATGPVPVPCGTSVDFVWCSQSMHSLIEMNPVGTSCTDVLAGAKDNLPDISGPGTTKTIVFAAPGVRRFKCAPHCGGGMQITFNVTCPPAGKAPSASPTGTRTKSPAPAKKPSGPAKAPKRSM